MYSTHVAPGWSMSCCLPLSSQVQWDDRAFSLITTSKAIISALVCPLPVAVASTVTVQESLATPSACPEWRQAYMHGPNLICVTSPSMCKIFPLGSTLASSGEVPTVKISPIARSCSWWVAMAMAAGLGGEAPQTIPNLRTAESPSFHVPKACSCCAQPQQRPHLACFPQILGWRWLSKSELPYTPTTRHVVLYIFTSPHIFAGQVHTAIDLDTNRRKSILDGGSWNINLEKIKSFNNVFIMNLFSVVFVCVCFVYFHNKGHYVSLVFWSPRSNSCFLISRGEMLSFSFWKTLHALLSHISANNCAYTYVYFCLYPWQMRKQFWREHTCSHADSLFVWIKFLLQTSAHRSIQLLIHPH